MTRFGAGGVGCLAGMVAGNMIQKEVSTVHYIQGRGKLMGGGMHTCIKQKKQMILGRYGTRHSTKYFFKRLRVEPPLHNLCAIPRMGN